MAPSRTVGRVGQEKGKEQEKKKKKKETETETRSSQEPEGGVGRRTLIAKSCLWRALLDDARAAVGTIMRWTYFWRPRKTNEKTPLPPTRSKLPAVSLCLSAFMSASGEVQWYR